MGNRSKLNVLYVASEAAPLVKVGGLGDVAGSLPKALRKLSPSQIDDISLDVRLAIPFHSRITQKLDNLQLIASFFVSHPNGPVPARAFHTIIEDVPVYLIEGGSILTDQNIYSNDTQADARKYLFFSLAVMELIKQINWEVDILHANDWQTALSVYDLKLRRTQDPFFKNTKSVLSMHNLPYMGAGAEPVVHEFGFSGCDCPNLPDWGRSIPLPIGMSAADQLLTVSPNYAAEILTPEYGCGLQDFLENRKESVGGILNGIDEEIWNPESDTAIHHNYNIKKIEHRSKNKTALQTELGLEKDANIPLIILISRMDQQKGIDIAINGLRMVMDLPLQMVFLGTGDPFIEASCRSLESEFPDKVRSVLRFDLNLSRRMYAGGDILLIPSRYEPCGLTQMIAMRYGCVPLARATGGLKDTIIDSPNNSANNGFLFADANEESFASTMRRAVHKFARKIEWKELQINGMSTDFSWEKSAIEYAKIYLKLKGV
jgi:starch synthase